MSDVRILRLTEVLPDSAVDPLAGHFLEPEAYDTLIQGENVNVLKPDGSPLLKLRSQVIPYEICLAAWRSLRKVNFGSANRGMAGGRVPGLEDGQRLFTGPKKTGRGSRGKLKGNVRMRPLKKDGTLSNTEYAAVYAAGNQLPSGIIGFFDRYARIPYCRMTAFNLEQPERFRRALPYIRAVNGVFAAEMPGRYAAQLEVVKKASQDFVIHNTAFTTLTVNKSWRTACHKDAGDLKEGFGVMTAIWAFWEVDRFKVHMNEARGNYLIFPKYRVAVSMTAGDVLLADVHEWHGNSPYEGVEGAVERISTVMYFREGIKHCGTAAEEKARADGRYGLSGRPTPGESKPMHD